MPALQGARPIVAEHPLTESVDEVAEELILGRYPAADIHLVRELAKRLVQAALLGDHLLRLPVWLGTGR